MKKFLLSAAIATVLTVASSTVQLAMSKEVRASAEPAPAPAPAPLKCAIHGGDVPSIRPHGPVKDTTRPCESYWAQDTDEDEREMRQLRSVAVATPATASMPVKR